MAGTLSASPAFPAADIRAVLDDMQSRYERAGVGQSGVASGALRCGVRERMARRGRAAYRVLTTTERDDYSHCDACVRSESAAYLAATGREDEAIALYEEIVEGGFSCGEEPEHALADALLPYLRAGRLERAKSFHLRSYRDARGNADNIGIIANHLVFCAITGNEARGLAMLERHLPTLVNDPINLSGHADGLIAVGVLLDAVARAGHGDLPVRGADAPDLARYLGTESTDAADWTVSAVAARAWAAAEHLTRAFDERNGNGFRTERLEAARALATEHWDLPLSVEGFAAPVAEPEPATTAAEWRERTSALLQSADPRGAIVAAEQGLALLADDADPDENLRAGLLGAIAQAAVIEGDDDRAGGGLGRPRHRAPCSRTHRGRRRRGPLRCGPPRHGDRGPTHPPARRARRRPSRPRRRGPAHPHARRHRTPCVRAGGSADRAGVRGTVHGDRRPARR